MLERFPLILHLTWKCDLMPAWRIIHTWQHNACSPTTVLLVPNVLRVAIEPWRLSLNTRTWNSALMCDTRVEEHTRPRRAAQPPCTAGPRAGRPEGEAGMRRPRRATFPLLVTAPRPRRARPRRCCPGCAYVQQAARTAWTRPLSLARFRGRCPASGSPRAGPCILAAVEHPAGWRRPSPRLLMGIWVSGFQFGAIVKSPWTYIF